MSKSRKCCLKNKIKTIKSKIYFCSQFFAPQMLQPAQKFKMFPDKSFWGREGELSSQYLHSTYIKKKLPKIISKNFIIFIDFMYLKNINTFLSFIFC